MVRRAIMFRVSAREIEMVMQMTRQTAYAAAKDTGNRAMKAGGRKTWSVDDYRRACAEFERLWPSDLLATKDADVELRPPT